MTENLHLLLEHTKKQDVFQKPFNTLMQMSQNLNCITNKVILVQLTWFWLTCILKEKFARFCMFWEVNRLWLLFWLLVKHVSQFVDSWFIFRIVGTCLGITYVEEFVMRWWGKRYTIIRPEKQSSVIWTFIYSCCVFIVYAPSIFKISE